MTPPEPKGAEEREELYRRLLDQGLMLPTKSLDLVLAEIRGAASAARKAALLEAAEWHDKESERWWRATQHASESDMAQRAKARGDGRSDAHATSAAHFRALAARSEAQEKQR